MIAEEEALVRGINNDRVFLQVLGFEVIEHAPDIVVDRLNAAQIVLDVVLISPLAEIVAFEAGGDVELHVGFPHMLAYAHAGAKGGLGSDRLHDTGT